MKSQGIIVFFIIAYGIPYGIMAAVEMTGALGFEEQGGVGQWALWGLYLFPLAGALAAKTIHPMPDAPAYRIWPVRWTHIIAAALGVAALFVLIIGAQILLGAAEPDWELPGLTDQFQGQQLEQTAPPANFLVLGYVLSIFLGLLYAIPYLAGEYAWRGFLLPRIAGLGAVRANLIVGVAWGLWFAPMAFTGIIASQDPYSSAARTILMAVILSFLLGSVLQRSKSLTLCAVIVGAFAVQVNGMAVYLLPRPNPPWSGAFGYVSIGVWLIAALVVWFWPHKKSASESETRPAA